MRLTVRLFVLSGCVLTMAVAVNAQGAAPPAAGQAPAAPAAGPGGPQAGPQNLQVLPRSWTTQQVGALMRTFTTSLGVQCTHCHSEDPDAPPPDPGQAPRLNYALDTKPTKDVARKMIAMVMDINDTALSGVGDAAVAEKVTCYSCHRGDTTPVNVPPDGWGRGVFSLSEAGPVVPQRGAGPGRGAAPGGARGGAPAGGGS